MVNDHDVRLAYNGLLLLYSPYSCYSNKIVVYWVLISKSGGEWRAEENSVINMPIPTGFSFLVFYCHYYMLHVSFIVD